MDRVVVVGAGCFGAWTAYHLARSGHEVTLLDAYGPGNSRASSGGETRIIRMGYGAQEIYTRWALRSLALWKALVERRDPTLFHETGVLWMARDDDPLTTPRSRRWNGPACRTSGCRARSSKRAGRRSISVPEPSSRGRIVRAAQRRADGAASRRRCRPRSRFGKAPATPRPRWTPPAIGRGRLEAVTTQSGATIGGATFVFACGPWLPKLFPDLLGDRIFATRQEILYFGPPAGDLRFAPPAMPAWIDFGEEMYGIPDIEARGFKIALDRHGPPFDPDTGDRLAGRTLAAVRAYLARRFPALARRAARRRGGLPVREHAATATS